MAFFEIFKQPVELIRVMSSITMMGKRYKKNSDKQLLSEIESKIEEMRRYFDRAGVPKVITKVHAGIMFEMAIQGDDLPSLAAIEQAIVETMNTDELDFEDTCLNMSKEQHELVDKMLKQISDRKRGNNEPA